MFTPNIPMDDDIRDMQNQFQKTTNSKPIRAQLGSVSGRIADPNIPGNVLFRTKTSLGPSAPRSAFLPGGINLVMKPGTPILIGYDYTGTRMVVLGPDADTSLATGSDTVSTTTRNNSPSTPQAYLETLRLIAKGGFLLSLKGWNPFINRLYNETSFTDIDIQPAQPAGGEMCYVVISVLGDLTDTEVTSSTPRSTSDEVLNPEDVQEAVDEANTNSTPVWALRITGDQTEILQTQIDNDLYTRDLRQVVNAKGIYEFTPTDSADPTGNTGDVAWDDDYIYVKTNLGWTRSALSTF